MILTLAPGPATFPQGEETWWASEQDSASHRRWGKGKGLTQCLSHNRLVHTSYLSSWMLALPGALSGLAEVSLVLQEGLWLQSYLERDPGQGWEENHRGTAMSGHQRGAGVPLCASAVFTDTPLCPGPGAAALNKWTGPIQARASPGCETSFQELHELLQ